MGYFLENSIDFSAGGQAVRQFKDNVIAIGDVLTMLVVPQRSLWLGTAIVIDVPIAGFAFDIRVADDAATGPVADFTAAADGVGSNMANRDDSVTTDDSPGVDGTGTAVTVVSAYSAATVSQMQYATAIANQPINEQAFLQLVVTAVPAANALATISRGIICVGINIGASQFSLIE